MLGPNDESSENLEREMATLLSELSDMARAIYQQLDERTARLESLIQAADERIEKLHRAQGEVPATETAQADDGPPAADPRHDQVYQLADEGVSPQQIAQRLGRPCGEIELILALRQ